MKPARLQLVLLAAAACAAPPGAVATVNGRPLTEADLAQQPPTRGHDAVPKSRAAVLDALIDEELAAQRAAEGGLALEPTAQRELERLEAQLGQARRRALANAWYARQAKEAAQVSETDARGYYLAHQRELQRQVRVAMAMRRSAAELSPDTLAETGWLTFAQLPPPWRPVLEKLQPGETSGVIAGPGERYWLVRLLEVREGPALDFEAARPQLEQLLGEERVRRAREGASAQLRQGARVVIHEAPAEAP